MSKTVPIDLEWVSETDLAALFRDEDDNEEWLPLSQIPGFIPANHSEGDFLVVDVPEWLAKDKGWI